MAARKRTSKKPQSVLPELLNKAINETLESLIRPIPPGEAGEIALGYRRALLRDRGRLESVILWRWRVLMEEDDPHHQEAESRFWAAVREGYDRCNAELAEAGFNPPGDDIQKWVRLAKVVETDPEFTNLGELTEEALTWAERESIRERIRQRVHAEWSEPMTEDIGPEERALALLVMHPEWSQTDMAKAVRVHRTTLYRFPRYQAAREALESGKADIPHGSKDKDGNLEAWACDTSCDTDD